MLKNTYMTMKAFTDEEITDKDKFPHRLTQFQYVEALEAQDIAEGGQPSKD